MLSEMATVSSLSLLETLPLLVLETVCAYLADSDSKRRSLFAFCLTSKRCCEVATGQRFKRICLTKLQGGRKLCRDLERWEELLSVEGRKRLVRQVKVVGKMLLASADGEGGEEEETITGEESGSPVTRAADKLFYEERDPETDEGIFWEPSDDLGLFDPSKPRLADEEKGRQEDVWFPFAQFIGQLPGLKDLIYGCAEQVPRCILSKLHESLPNTRLHIPLFSLRSLFQSKGDPQDIDPDEFTLATSPCLYSITVPCYGYDSYGQVNYNEEAVLKMVAGSAPNLTVVRIWQAEVGDSLDLRRAYQTGKPIWTGFFMDRSQGVEKPLDTTQTTKGSLRDLVLSGASSMSPDELLNWNHYTDFSRLETLEIDHSMDAQALQVLQGLAEGQGLQSLRSLTLCIDIYEDEDSSHLDNATSQLLQAITPLENLKLKGPIAEETVSSILDHHQRLHRLHLMPTPREAKGPFTLSASHVQRLQQRCPKLQSVTFPIRRTMGDEQEVFIYRALGGLKRLKHVSLFLDCATTPEDPPSPRPGRTDSPAFPPCDYVLRNALLNAAIDSSLALSIFNTISTANTLARIPGLSPSLQSLRLQVSGAADSDEARQGWDPDLENIFRWVARGWICTRDPRQGHETEVVAREIDEQGRLDLAEDLDWPDDKTFGSLPRYKRVWREVWPAKTDDWKEDWCSVPLSEVDSGLSK